MLRCWICLDLGFAWNPTRAKSCSGLKSRSSAVLLGRGSEPENSSDPKLARRQDLLLADYRRRNERRQDARENPLGSHSSRKLRCLATSRWSRQASVLSTSPEKRRINPSAQCCSLPEMLVRPKRRQQDRMLEAPQSSSRHARPGKSSSPNPSERWPQKLLAKFNLLESPISENSVRPKSCTEPPKKKVEKKTCVAQRKRLDGRHRPNCGRRLPTGEQRERVT